MSQLQQHHLATEHCSHVHLLAVKRVRAQLCLCMNLVSCVITYSHQQQSNELYKVPQLVIAYNFTTLSLIQAHLAALSVLQ
eukprot:13404-Heterococcus_DN1.PRE.1